MVSSYQVNLGKGGAAAKAVGVVLYVWDWIPVRDGASVKGSVVSTGPPAAVLRHELEGGDHGPSARLEVPSYSMASNSALATAKRSGARRRGRQATGEPGVVLELGWLPPASVSPGNSSRRLSVGVSPAITFTQGTDGGAMRPGVDSDVTPSIRRLFLQSTRSPQWESRSTPMMGKSTSAMTKGHVNSRRSPRFRLLEAHP